MSDHICTLTTLYPSLEMRLIVRYELSKMFERKFVMLISECSHFRPFLVSPLKFYKFELQELFLEEGLQLDSAEDLEDALGTLGYLRWKKFAKAKETFDKSTGTFNSNKKCLKFDLDKNQYYC